MIFNGKLELDLKESPSRLPLPEYLQAQPGLKSAEFSACVASALGYDKWCHRYHVAWLCQGQARGYGRITQFCPLPFWGHYFHVVTVANSMDRISCKRYQMKDLNLIFPLIPQNLILVEWFSNRQWLVKVGQFLAFFIKWPFPSSSKNSFLDNFFQNALIFR